MFIGIENGLLDRDRRFVGHFTKIVNTQAFLVGQLRTDRRAVRIQHTTARQAIKPLLTADRLKVFTQAVKHCQPLTGRQVEGAGLVLGGVKALGRHKKLGQ